LPAELAGKPFLAPIYGCTAFIVRDVIRRYAGWWSGQPSQLFPVSRRDHARDLLALCGRDALLAQARSLRNSGQLKRALAIADEAVDGDAEDQEARRLNAEILEAMASTEPSFIARNLFRGAGRRLLHGLNRPKTP